MHMNTKIAVLMLAVSMSASAATKCEGLGGLKLPDTPIPLAQVVGAGAFVPPAPEAPGASSAAAYKDLPAFCRVAAEIKPAKDSDIKMEVWMPVSGWTGRYEGVGNGGFAGSITYLGLAGALRQGSRRPLILDTAAARWMEAGRWDIRTRSRILAIALS